MSVFGDAYATSYDLLYDDKDYEAECDLIEKVVRDYGLNPTRSILDLGCGTGNHALPLSRRGYAVTGVDRSEQMLSQIRAKASRSGLSGLALQSGDIRSVELAGKFDAALMMFAVLGYQLTNEDVLASLRTARKHLNPGGLLIFDVWYGPAVLHIRPSERVKVIRTTEGEMIRVANGTLDIPAQTCTVNYKVWRIKGEQLVARVEESHQMRYFFPFELDLLLEKAGFIPMRSGAFPEFSRDPDEDTWSVLIAARCA